MIATLEGGAKIVDLNKSFGANTVLHDVSVEFKPGRIHALLGANGAGKSTLLGCLSGAVRPDSGAIIVRNRSHESFTPRSAFDNGIAIIYQHFQLIGPLTVADNIFLGQELRTPFGTIDRRQQNREAAAILEQLKLPMDPNSTVESLGVGHQQMVEIARAIRRDPGVLILDEPTAALGTHEIDALLELVRRLAHERDLAIVYVTHLLGEVMSMADDVTMLRNGRVFWQRERSQIGMAELIDGISPAMSSASEVERREVSSDPMLVLEGYSSPYTGPINLTVCGGEIVGVFGLLGSGRTDLLESLAGVRSSHGSVRIDGDVVKSGSPRRAIDAGISLVASDRKQQSLFGEMSAIDNLLMPHYSSLSRVLRRPNIERKLFGTAANETGLVPAEPGLTADSFSGGNAQKIAVSRWMVASGRIKALLLDEPTQGVDIGSRKDLYTLIREFAKKESAAVLFASSDPDEVLSLADRVLILVEGHSVYFGEVPADEKGLMALAQPATTDEGF